MTENQFVGEVARSYDDRLGRMGEAAAIDPAVECLAELVELAESCDGDRGPVLELAIGTGRIALPLSARGVEVAGIELSADTLAELRAKPGSEAIRTVEGDMATATAPPPGPGGFALVYLVFNTITNLTTQDAQVRCFENAAG